MTLTQAIKYGTEKYSELPAVLQKSVDFINKATKNGSDLESYKQNETIKKVIDLAVTKLNDQRSDMHDDVDWNKVAKAVKSKGNSKAVKEILKTAEKTNTVKPKFPVGSIVYTNAYGNPTEPLSVQSIFKNSKGFVVPGGGPAKPIISYTYVLSNGESLSEEYLTAIKPIENKSKKGAKASTKKEKKEKHHAINQVELLPDEIKIMKRFVGMQGKTKTPDQVHNLLDSLQKAIIEKRINKQSKFANEINEIQTRLVKSYKSMVKSRVSALEVKIETEFYNKVKAIVDNYESLKSVALIKRYINLDGRKQTKEKAEKLLEQVLLFIQKEPRDRYIENLRLIAKDLAKYAKTDSGPLNVQEQSLTGIPWAIMAAKAVQAGKMIKDGAVKIYNHAKPKVKAAYDTAKPKVVAAVKNAKAKINTTTQKKSPKKSSKKHTAFPKKLRSNYSAKPPIFEAFIDGKWKAIGENVFNSCRANAGVINSYYQDEQKSGGFKVWYLTKDENLKGASKHIFTLSLNTKDATFKALSGWFRKNKDESDDEYIKHATEKVITTLKNLAKKHGGTVIVHSEKKGQQNIQFSFPTPEANAAFQKELDELNNSTLHGIEDAEPVEDINRGMGEIDQLFSTPVRDKGPRFRLYGDLGLFLGDLEQYECGITIEGFQGSGKSQLAYQIANGFLDLDKKVSMLCYELPHDSAPMQAYMNQYVSKVNQDKLKQKSDMPRGLAFVEKIAPAFDVIIIDSWGKLGEKNKEFEKLIKAHPKTIFVVIIQRLSSGDVRGGNDPKYDGGINIEIEKIDNSFEKNYAITTKNRYGRSGLKYNIASQKLVA